MVGYARFIDKREEFKHERPYTCMYLDESSLGIPPRNVTYTERPLALTDLRSLPKSEWPTLEKNHFQYLEHHSKELLNNPSESNAQPLADETAEWLKELVGADLVFPWVSRFRSAEKAHNRPPPATDPHSDFDKVSGIKILAGQLSQEERDAVLSGKTRAQIINVWRPLHNPAEDYPLAILDPTTLDPDEDLIIVDRLSYGANMPSDNIAYNPNHRWYWLSKQRPEEVVVFVQYDTHPPEDLLNHIGHSAFRNADAPPDCLPRQSVETRCIVLSPAPPRPMVDSSKEPEDHRVRPWHGRINVPEFEIPPPADPKTRRLATGPPPQPQKPGEIEVA